MNELSCCLEPIQNLNFRWKIESKVNILIFRVRFYICQRSAESLWKWLYFHFRTMHFNQLRFFWKCAKPLLVLWMILVRDVNIIFKNDMKIVFWFEWPTKNLNLEWTLLVFRIVHQKTVNFDRKALLFYSLSQQIWWRGLLLWLAGLWPKNDQHCRLKFDANNPWSLDERMCII